MQIHKHTSPQKNHTPQTSINACLNVNCDKEVNTLSKNKLGLCERCFGPFWSVGEDLKDLRMKKGIVGVYHRMIMNGCANINCKNTVCTIS